MDDTLKQQLMFEANRKSTAASYILWFFLGGLGAHRFYLRRPVSGALQLMLGLFGWMPLFVGWVVLGLWWLVDAFLIPDMTRQENIDTIQRLDDDRRQHELAEERRYQRLEDDRSYRGPSRPLPRAR